MARYYDRTRLMLRTRRKVEALLAGLLIVLFQRLWRLLSVRLRNNRVDEIDTMLAAWEDDAYDELGGVILAGARQYAEAESKWWSGNGVSVALDAAQLVADYEARTAALTGNPRGAIGDMAASLHQRILEGIRAGATPEQLQSLINQAKAQAIAGYQAGQLMSIAADRAMREAGVGRWMSQSREDAKVCRFPDGFQADGTGCLELHGQIFTVHDPMPPYHYGPCRCEPVPIV